MSLLTYKSNEMFSATDLIRKSKTIFDKIVDKKIEKAIILRDGKPSFLLMDFAKYEKIMSEYEKLKGKKASTIVAKEEQPIEEKPLEMVEESIPQEIAIDTKIVSISETLSEEEKQKLALKLEKAKKERELLAKEQAQKLQEEQELEAQIEAEKRKKEQELEEFWD